MTTPAPAPRRLADHITEALNAMAARITTRHPDRAAELADWLETAHERLVVVAVVDQRRNGRIDTRSYRLDVYLTTEAGPAPLCSVRRRDLFIPPELEADDPQTEARTLLLQHGYGIPDDPGPLTDNPA